LTAYLRENFVGIFLKVSKCQLHRHYWKHVSL